MHAYDFDKLAHDLDRWMTSRFLPPILDIEGGWEYWVQIDFPAWLDVSDHVQYDFRREVGGVLPSGRLDWLVNSQGVGGQLTAVEIKAQTHKYLNQRFIADALADVHKLAALGGNYNALMLAAAIDPAVVDQLTQRHGFGLLVTYAQKVAFLVHVR